jgi:hypothetical protein
MGRRKKVTPQVTEPVVAPAPVVAEAVPEPVVAAEPAPEPVTVVIVEKQDDPEPEISAATRAEMEAGRRALKKFQD